VPTNLLPGQQALYLDGLSLGGFGKVQIAFAGIAQVGVNSKGLSEAITSLFASIPAFNQRLCWDNDRPVLVDNRNIQLHSIDVASQAGDRLKTELLIELGADISQSDSSAALLVDCGNNYFELYLLIDHIYVDGVSLQILGSELGKIWQGQKSLALATAGEVSSALSDEWNRMGSNGLAGYSGATCSPWIPAQEVNVGGAVSRSVVASCEGSGLGKIMTDLYATKFQIFLAAYGLSISTAFKTRDFVVAVPTAGMRIRDPRVLAAIGCFTNTVYVRVDLRDARTFADVVSVTRDRLLDAFERDIPAIAEIDSEFAAAARGGHWLVRRLRYPIIIPQLEVSKDSRLERIPFPEAAESFVHCLMTVALRAFDSRLVRFDVEGRSDEQSLTDTVGRTISEVIRATGLQGGAALQDEVEEVSQYPSGFWNSDTAGAPNAGTVPDIVPWLNEVLHNNRAIGVFPDLIERLDVDSRQTARSDVLSLLRAYELHKELVGDMPLELVRRDATLEGLRMSRQCFDKIH
jgi:hypothetical protein